MISCLDQAVCMTYSTRSSDQTWPQERLELVLASLPILAKYRVHVVLV